MGALTSYRLRLKRKRYKLRARIKGRQLISCVDRTATIQPDDILLFATVRNEEQRLPHFLRYYRTLGVKHFLFVDNKSSDNSFAFLKDQSDVSLWQTDQSYRRARFGVDWLGYLRLKYAHGHWALTVDADELFVYPHCDTRPLQALTDWLDSAEVRSFGCLLYTSPSPRDGATSRMPSSA